MILEISLGSLLITSVTTVVGGALLGYMILRQRAWQLAQQQAAKQTVMATVSRTRD